MALFYTPLGGVVEADLPMSLGSLSHTFGGCGVGEFVRECELFALASRLF